MRKSTSVLCGLMLIAIGVVALLSQLGIIDLSRLERLILPLVLAVLAVFFHGLYFAGGRTNPGLLVPGGVMLMYAVLFGLCTVWGYHWMSRLFPLFIAGPALGLTEMNLARRAPSPAWQTPVVLWIVSAVLLLVVGFDFSWPMLMAVGLIVAGIAVLFPVIFRRGGNGSQS